MRLKALGRRRDQPSHERAVSLPRLHKAASHRAKGAAKAGGGLAQRTCSRRFAARSEGCAGSDALSPFILNLTMMEPGSKSVISRQSTGIPGARQSIQ